MLNGLDLFSGIGGIAKALEPWVRVRAYCEVDKYAQAVLLSQMSTGRLSMAPIWDDVRTLHAGLLPAVDIITGGFPCQDISAAGVGIGLGGERSGLFQHIARLVSETNPRFVFLENVPAIRTRGLNGVAQTFTELGYDCRWTVVSAQEFGAPHLRKRWFLLAHAMRERGWIQQRRRERSSGQAEAVTLNDGKSQSLADSDGGRLPDAADKPGKTWSEGKAIVGARTAISSCASVGDSWWATEPNVGRNFNGLSAWLDKAGEVGEKMAQRIVVYAASEKTRPEEVLRVLLERADAQDLQWEAGGPECVSPQAVLQSCLLRIQERGFEQARLQLASEKAPEEFLRGVWNDKEPARSPRRPKPGQQSAGEHSNRLQELARLLALDAEEAWSAYRWQNARPLLERWLPGWESGISRTQHNVPNRVERIRGLGNAVVPLQARTAFERLIGIEGG